jgi:hypothetical protein
LAVCVCLLRWTCRRQQGAWQCQVFHPHLSLTGVRDQLASSYTVDTPTCMGQENMEWIICLSLGVESLQSRTVVTWDAISVCWITSVFWWTTLLIPKEHLRGLVRRCAIMPYHERFPTHLIRTSSTLACSGAAMKVRQCLQSCRSCSCRCLCKTCVDKVTYETNFELLVADLLLSHLHHDHNAPSSIVSIG